MKLSGQTIGTYNATRGATIENLSHAYTYSSISG